MRTARVLAAVAGRAFDAVAEGNAGDRALLVVRQRLDESGGAEAARIVDDNIGVLEDLSEVAQQLQIMVEMMRSFSAS